MPRAKKLSGPDQRGQNIWKLALMQCRKGFRSIHLTAGFYTSIGV